MPDTTVETTGGGLYFEQNYNFYRIKAYSFIVENVIARYAFYMKAFILLNWSESWKSRWCYFILLGPIAITSIKQIIKINLFLSLFNQVFISVTAC